MVQLDLTRVLLFRMGTQKLESYLNHTRKSAARCVTQEFENPLVYEKLISLIPPGPHSGHAACDMHVNFPTISKS